MFFRHPRSSPRSTEAPLKEAGETSWLRSTAEEEPQPPFQKGKTPSVLRSTGTLRYELREPVNLALFHYSTQGQPDLAALNTEHSPGVEQQIISTIKTFRKWN